MDRNNNSQTLGENNANEVHNYQHFTKLTQMIILPENQYDHSLLNSKGHYRSSSVVIPDKGRIRKNLVTFKGYPLRKYKIHLRDRTEPHGSKPHYKGSDNFYTELSHSE